jgi:hypothetical protein
LRGRITSCFGDKQDAVEVIADVVHRHRERDLRQQALERLLRHREHGAEAGRFLHQREVFGRHALQREAALATLEDEFAAGVFEADRLVGRHGAQDVDQLARAQRGGEVAVVAIEGGGGADLDFEVAGGQLDLRTGLAQQHIGEDGQRVAPFDDAGDGLERCQYVGLGRFQNDHVRLFRRWLTGALSQALSSGCALSPPKPQNWAIFAFL